ncbi:MAG: SLC13 family permease [Bacteroidota bacterium]
METTISYWPLVVLLLGTITVVFCIVTLRLPAFIALMLGAITVGILGVSTAGDANAWVAAVEKTMVEFGVTAGKVAFVIAIASVLGIAMTESGAAEKIVNRLIQIFGESRAGIALMVAGFILSIPVFFDTVFFLMVPLAIVLAQKTGKNFVLFVMAIGCGAVITHSVVPPTPGPLLCAEDLQLDMGLVIGLSILSGIFPAFVGYKYSQRLNAKMHIEPPEFVEENIGKRSSALPSFGVSMLPILLPLVLIIIASVLKVFYPDRNDFFTQSLTFLGNKNIAMFLGLLISLYLWAKYQQLSLKQLGEKMERPLEIAGLIILITAAGGAFGAMIRNTGIGDLIQDLSANGFSLNLIVVAWLMAAVVKFAQGSSTVAIITTSGIMSAIIANSILPYHPIYLFFGIGYGAMFGSWMNDSGFWIVGKLSGLTEKQTFQMWSILLAVIGVVGGLQAWVFSYVLPMN